jgi:hypothetical protein
LNVVGCSGEAAAQPYNVTHDYSSNNDARDGDSFGHGKPPHSVENGEQGNAEAKKLDGIRYPVPALAVMR